MCAIISGIPNLVNAHQEARITQLEKTEKQLRSEIDGWKRLCVVCAAAFEPLRMSGSSDRLSPDLKMAVDNAVIGIRLAITKGSLPPEGAYDDAIAHIRAIAGISP